MANLHLQGSAYLRDSAERLTSWAQAQNPSIHSASIQLTRAEFVAACREGKAVMTDKGWQLLVELDQVGVTMTLRQILVREEKDGVQPELKPYPDLPVEGKEDS